MKKSATIIRLFRRFALISLILAGMLVEQGDTQSVRGDGDINPEIVFLYTTGKTLQALGSRQQATGYLQQAWQRAPRSVEIGLAYAEALSELRQFPSALEVIDSLPQDVADVQLWRAYLLRSVNREAEAMVAFRKVVALDSTNANAFSYLAAHFAATRQNDSAIWAFKKLGTLLPQNPRPWNEAAQLQIEQQDIPGARESFRKSVLADKSIQNYDGVLGMARTFVATNVLDSALPFARLVVDYLPYETAGYRLLSIIYGGLDSLPQAIKSVNRGLGARPRDPDLRRQLGVLYFDADSLLESEQVLRGLIKDSLADHISYLVLSQIKLRQHDTASALNVADQGTIQFPHLSQVWINLADIERRRGQLKLAIATLKEGLQVAPVTADSVTLRAVLADMYAADHDYPSAYEHYEFALLHRGEDPTLLNNYGYLLADRNERIDDAYTMIKKATELRPDASFIKDSYGWVLYRKGKFDEALTYLLEAHAASPNAETSEHIGDVYAAKKDLARAIEWWQRSLEQNPTREAVKEKLRQQ